MFPQLSSTAESLSKASTMVFRIGTDAHLYDDPEDVNIAPFLDSKYDSEKSESLKRLLAFIAQGFDVSNFFPQVVKNVGSQSLEVKKLVYLYLLHYAEKRPNEALLSINYFQKDLGDPNPLVRAWALRAMAGIRLHVIAPLVLVAVGKCARDPSVYVRKCAANALTKLYDMRLEEHNIALKEIVGILLNDNSPGVIGAAAAVFSSICPNNFVLIGRSYKKLCESLPDVEEWGQIALIWILLRYVIARHGLVKESIMYSLHRAEGDYSDKDGLDRKVAAEEGDVISGIYESEVVTMISRCYIEGPDEYLSRLSYGNRGSLMLDDARFTSGKSSDDVRLLLQCTLPLLWSQNSAVVLAAASVHWIMAPTDDVERIVKPLLFVLRSSRASQYVVLCNIQVFAKAIPSLFASHFEEFLISSSDSYQIRTLKLDILSSIATDSSISIIFQEFQDYIRDPDRRFAADTVAAIGLCAQRLPKVTDMCLEGLLALTRQETLTSDSGPVYAEADVLIQAVMSIKEIINHDSLTHEKVIIKLVRSLDSIKVPAARAMIIWMLGEYSSMGEIIPKMLITVLQYLVQCFVLEAWETKLQILNTSVKALNSRDGLQENGNLWTIKRILSYLLELAECDLNYDVRDRARFIKQLLSHHLVSDGVERETYCLPGKNDLPLKLVECMFRGPKNQASPEPINYRFYLPGSLSQIVFHAAPGYEPLPKPIDLLINDLNTRLALRQGASHSDSNERGSGTSSGSLNEESASGSSSQHSDSDASDSGGSASESDINVNSLINFCDDGPGNTRHNEESLLCSEDLENLMSKRALESWLDEKPASLKSHVSGEGQIRKSSAKILIGDLSSRVKPKRYTLLDPANGNGLKVDYSFSSESSCISPLLVHVGVFFENCSKEHVTKLILVDEESDRRLDSDYQSSVTSESSTTHDDVPTLVPVEEITSLEPGQLAKRIIEVRFHHHLLPLKLALWCNGKKYPVKLWPDIGYFIKPLPTNIKAFLNKESQLPGMFEYTRRCTFTDHIGELNSDQSLVKDKFIVICESLALKMLSNANLFLVSVDMPVASNLDDASGLCLRFSSEILSNPVPCLVTVIIEGKCSEPLNVTVKVNCEETVFGLNLLNRVINFLVEPSITR